jgi:hypothetical protein
MTNLMRAVQAKTHSFSSYKFQLLPFSGESNYLFIVLIHQEAVRYRCLGVHFMICWGPTYRLRNRIKNEKVPQ